MQGRKGSFTVGGVTLHLSRPNMQEMFVIEPNVTAFLGDPEVSEFAGDIDAILELAVAHEGEEDKAKFKAMQDAGDRLELFDQYAEFARLEDFLLSRALKRLERIKCIRIAQMKQAGYTEQEAESLFRGNLTILQDSMNASLLGTASHPQPSKA